MSAAIPGGRYIKPMSPPLPPWLWPTAAYIHIPFCAHHCGYCDFAVAVGQDHLRDAYLDALDNELATLGQPQPVQTLFFGGGTPSHLTARQLESLLSRVLRWLPLEEDRELAMYTTAMDVLEDAGFEHYEISNFARPGFRCRHNQVYWANHAYF